MDQHERIRIDIQIEELPNSVRDAIKAMKHEEYTHT